MSRETTPPEITPMILDCCKTLNSQILPFYVDVIPDPDALMNECFPNVQRKIARDGGTHINGWAIWQWANIMIEAEAHSVWKTADGKLIDITPHSHQERQILFVPDKCVKFEGVIIPNKRAPMTKSLKVARLIDLCNTRDYIAQQAGASKTYSLPMGMAQEIIALQREIAQRVDRNTLCPCGSGLKYKKCCGLYENI